MMKKLLAAAVAVAISGVAFAQDAAPAATDASVATKAPAKVEVKKAKKLAAKKVAVKSVGAKSSEAKSVDNSNKLAPLAADKKDSKDAVKTA